MHIGTEHIILMVLSAIGLAILFFEVYLKNRREIQSSKDRRERLDREQLYHDRSLDLLNRRYELERDNLIRQGSIIEAYRPTLESISPKIAESLKSSLISNVDWLARALQKTDFAPYSDSLFGERSGHYQKEKIYLCNMFFEALKQRISKLEDVSVVRIIIDSGTTLFPIFDKLRTLDEERIGEKKIDIVTNNIPGFMKLIDSHRINQKSGITFSIVAGAPLSEYAAITGDAAVTSLRFICEKKSVHNKGESVYTIGIITGNWIRIRNTSPVCPIPLARGSGHLEFKEEIMRSSDEVYVVGPLGKIFQAGVGDFNNIYKPEKDQPYTEVKTDQLGDDFDVSKIKLVATMRTTDDQLLYTHSTQLQKIFKKDADSVNSVNTKVAKLTDTHGSHKDENISECNLILIPYDHIGVDKLSQRDLDFPHRKSHRHEFFELFGVPHRD